MNQTQKRYALQRVDDIGIEKNKAIKAKYRIAPKRISDDEKADLIYKGKVKLLPRKDIKPHYTDLVDAYDFSKYESDESFKAGYLDKVSELCEATKKAKDQIMLGDSEEALSLISQLERIKV